MKFCCVEIRKLRRHVIPLLCRGFLYAGILSRTVPTLLVKYRFCRVEFNQLGFDGFSFLWFTCLKNISPETGVDVANLRTFNLVFEVPKIVLKFFLKESLRERIRNLCILTICTVHLPCCFQGRSIIFQENMIGVYHKVIEVIGCAHHHCGNIVVISTRVTQIYFFAVICDRTQLETDLLSYRFVVFWA